MISACRRGGVAPVLVVVLLLAHAPARALTDRQHLEKWCTHGSSVAAGRCIGYLLAAEDALATGSVEGVRACLPRDIGLTEQHSVVLDWLRTHPEAQASTALGLVAQAYAASYPCRQP